MTRSQNPPSQGLPNGDDPRQYMPQDDLLEATQAAMPSVARTSQTADLLGNAMMIVGILGVGVLTYMTLSGPETPKTQAPPPVKAPARDLPLLTDSTVGQPTPEIPQPLPPTIVTPPAPMPQPQPPAPAPLVGLAPALIVDNSTQPTTTPEGTAGAQPGVGNALLNADEQFSQRLMGNRNAKTERMADLSNTVPEGAIIPAVLETALNSDLPGYARAVVSRDIKGFDGSRTVIPRGSRLIGQYRSGLSSGVTRVFIIWTRVIRPDGVSVQLGSPVTDELGQAGLTGKVDTHFTKRFGAAFLLSMVNGLVSNNANSSNTIVIGTASGAQTAATDALNADAKIPPTIKIAQGTNIQVFAAHDLYFGRFNEP